GNNGNDESILLGSSIALSQSYKSINRTTHVNKGDLIFFRSHNIKYGCGGKVKLANAQVKYTGFDQSVPTPPQTNELGQNLKTYRLQEDYILNNGGQKILPNGTHINKIKFNLSPNDFDNGLFPDDVRFVVQIIKT